MAAYEVALDHDRCCGFGLCVPYAPELFSQDTAGTAVLHAGPAVPDGLVDAVRSAVRACPQQVITLRLAPVSYSIDIDCT